MRLPKFDHLRPASLEEACALLAEHRGEARILSGGTALLTYLGQRLLTPKYVISLRGISGLNYIEYDEANGLRIGALTPISDVVTSPVIQERYPLLCQAAKGIGVPAIRYMGTVGGNLCLDTRCIYYNQSFFWRQVRPACFKRGGKLCHAVKGGEGCYSVYQGDLAPALLALDARVKLAEAGGERLIPLSELFTGRGEAPLSLDPEEILTEVQIPPLPQNSVGSYQKLRVREAVDFPLAGVAVMLNLDGGKVCSRARVVLGAVGPAPIEVAEAEQALQGEEITAKEVNEAAEEAFKNAHPVNNLSLGAPYRRKMVRVLLKRAVDQCLKLAEAQPS